MKIGLYFGSFNPIHIGHLIIASHVVENTDLDKIWFVVSPQNPLKPSHTLLNEYQRLHMVRLAIENDTRFKAVDIEFKLPKPSYTIDTLIHLEEKYPEHIFSVIMGSDSYQNINKWKNGDLLQKNYNILIYNRPGFEIEETTISNCNILNAPLLDISSTLIRNNLKQGLCIKYLVTDLVYDELMNNKYYK